MRRRIGNLPGKMVIECGDCHFEWHARTDPALAVPCPYCSAPAGSKCRRPSEHRVPGVVVHAERDLAALRAGAYGTHRQDGRCTVSHLEAVARAERRVARLRRTTRTSMRCG